MQSISSAYLPQSCAEKVKIAITFYHSTQERVTYHYSASGQPNQEAMHGTLVHRA